MINPTEIKSAEEMELISILAYIENSAIEGARITTYYSTIRGENIAKLENLGYNVGEQKGDLSGRIISW